MKPYETTAHVGPDGSVYIRAPLDMANSDVRVFLEASTPPSNGVSPAIAALPPRLDPAERRRILDATVGSIDDPTFERPPQGQFDDVEPLD